MVLEIVAWAIESIVLVDADFLLLTRAVHEDAAEHYHTLSDRDVDEERADYAKPSFVRSWAFEMYSYGMTINVHIENLRFEFFQKWHLTSK